MLEPLINVCKKLRNKTRRKVRNRRKRYLYQENVLGIPSNGKQTNKLTKEIEIIVDSFLKKDEPRVFFFNSESKDKLVRLLTDEFGSRIKQDIANADRICRHFVPIFGYGFVNVFKNIKWNEDFVSGKTWESDYYTKIDILKFGQSADVKVPWELNRMHQLTALGKAFFFHRKPKYVDEFKNQVIDWTEKNPPLYGINWTCAMEVAIRAINLIWALFLFKDSGELDKDFLKSYITTIYNHGRYIFYNLENEGPSPNNHFLANLAGLIFISTIFPEFSESSEWYAFAKKEMENEMDRQVNEDGSYYESSIPYHGLVTELFLLSTILIVRNEKGNQEDWKDVKLIKDILPDKYLSKLSKMITFILHYTKPIGKAPQIGDNDSGTVLPICNYGNTTKCDHRHLLAIAGELFNNDQFRSAAENQYEGAIWFFNGRLDKKNSLSFSPVSASFNDIGIYVMRHRDNYMLIKCGKNGTNGIGTHTHNDMLSFELRIGKHDIIVDPGTFTYNRDLEMRNLFRSTSYHNTVKIDNVEINHFDNKNMFSLSNDATPKIIAWKTEKDIDVFEGEHNGYTRLEQPVIHRRQIHFHKRAEEWIVTDKFIGRGKHFIEWNFHFDKGLLISKDGDSLIIRKGKINILQIWFGTNLPIELKPYFLSTAYGKKEKSTKATFILQRELPYEMEFILRRI